MNGWLAFLVPLLSAILGAVVGSLLVHRLTSIREIRGARREQRIDYLVQAYRRLIDAANRHDNLTDEQIAGLETSLSDIVLLGEVQEVEAARRFMLNMAEGRGADLEEVISALRSSLRREIELSNIDLPRPYNFRMVRGIKGESR